jgi:hypothetical protein
LKKIKNVLLLLAATQMMGACIIEVYSGDEYEDDSYYSEECPYYENAPYSHDPDSCSTNQYADCCLWDVEDRYDRVCHEYWCYKYDECVWEYERIICE